MKARAIALKLLAPLIALLLLAGCERKAAPPAARPEPPVAVQTVRAHRGEVWRSITLPGEVHPYFQVTLFTKVSGYLQKLTVDKGDSAKAGDLIADIEVPELKADKVRQAAELELATAEFERLNAAAGASPSDEVRRNLAVAKGKLAVAKANLDYTTTMLSYAQITAPFDGVITKRYVDPGAFIPAPNAADTPEAAAIVNLTDYKTLRIQIPVPENEAPHIERGLPVEFVADALPGRKFSGTVTRYYQALNDKTKTMLTEVQMTNSTLELRPGMLITGTIRVEKRTNALLVPAGAVLRDKSGSFAFVASNGAAKRVVVRTGFSDGANTEIVSGVGEQDAVIVSNQAALRDGSAVQVSEASGH
ncbi:MAG: putative secretion protein [Verrucomicrobiota bacterium]|jgi:RND family efflux transporter MFP subunit